METVRVKWQAALTHELQGWTSRAESRRSASRLGDSALILDFTELLDTTAAGPVHVLSALKVAMNETYCLILFKSSTCALVKPTSVTVWPGPP